MPSYASLHTAHLASSSSLFQLSALLQLPFAMSALNSQSQLGRSSSPSPAGLLRRHRSSDAATDHSPWRRSPANNGRGGWVRPSVSPFERSGRTILPTHGIYGEVAPADDHPMTGGRNGGNGDGNDDDDDWMCDDDAFYEEDGEVLSQEMARGSSWLRGFLEQMGKMSSKEMDDPAAVVPCPACKRCPGESLRYRGLQGLVDHARSVMAKRVKLHRRFAEILEEDLRNRRGSQGGGSEEVRAAGEQRKCQGLGDVEDVAGDGMILWPPMVVVLNTRLGKQEGSDKWMGMGNRDLVDCFAEYEPIKARSAYGSRGHCGASLLIFDGTVWGYLRAQRLHGQFIQEGRGKYEWHKQKPWKQATMKRLLYGYMATTVMDLALFNASSGDKHKLKYDMKPYQVVVGNPLKEMYGRSQNQALLEREVAKEVERSQNLEKTCEQRGLEIQAIRRMINEQSDEHNKEIESLNECNKRLHSMLKLIELERKKIQEQISSPRSTGDDQGETSLTELANQMNLGDAGHDKFPENEMDETAEEQLYLELGASHSKDKKKQAAAYGTRRPL